MPAEALLLFLIIFVVDAAALLGARAVPHATTTRSAGLPMLPVTHGQRYTRLMIVLYTVVLVAVTLLPFAIRMSGPLYLVAALALGGVFLALRDRALPPLQRRARPRTFRYSILYLAALFSALLIDHYWR